MKASIVERCDARIDRGSFLQTPSIAELSTERHALEGTSTRASRRVAARRKGG
jgi:hypothetical protein